jgi:hypothetical protein
MTTKEALRQLIDQLTDEDLAAAEAFIQFLAYRRAATPAEQEDDFPDALLALLAAAPEDDEPLFPGEDDGDAETLREFQDNYFLTAQQARAQLLDLPVRPGELLE